MKAYFRCICKENRQRIRTIIAFPEDFNPQYGLPKDDEIVISETESTSPPIKRNYYVGWGSDTLCLPADNARTKEVAELIRAIRKGVSIEEVKHCHVMCGEGDSKDIERALMFSEVDIDDKLVAELIELGESNDYRFQQKVNNLYNSLKLPGKPII